MQGSNNHRRAQWLTDKPAADIVGPDRIDYGDVREVLPQYINDGVQVDTVVTSPPYWGLRDYGSPGQLGLEPSMDSYVANMADVFDLVRGVLSDHGTLWLNLGDSYVAQRKGPGGKDKSTLSDPDAPKRTHTDSFFVRYSRKSFLRRKNLIGLPWRVAFALQSRGWILRDCIIWNKPNPLPESAKDRCTKAHEYIFMLSKGPQYYYDHEAISEQRLTDHDKPIGGWRHGEGSHDPIDHNRPLEDSGPKYDYRDAKTKPAGERRTRRSVWTIPTEPYKERHFATFPTGVAAPCVLAGCPKNGTVLDPFMGTGTVAAVAQALGRHYLGIEINEADYRPLIEDRLRNTQGMKL